MKEEEILKLISTLIGNIEPIGEDDYDDKVKENLSKLIAVIKQLHLKVSDVLDHTSESKYNSMKDIYKMCDEYFDWLGIKEE